PIFVEFPILVAIAAEPMAAVVMPLIGEAHGDAAVAEGPHFLDQPVVELAVPFADQEGFDLLAPVNELGAITPAAVHRIGERDTRGIAGVPRILGQAGL